MSDTAVLPAAVLPLPPPGAYSLAGCVLERTPFPFLHRRIPTDGGSLTIDDGATLTLPGLITATVFAQRRRQLLITGRLDLRGRRHGLRLTARVVHIDDTSLVFAASGVAAATGHRPLRIEAAMEFLR
ncbi:hypothetical protein [Kutzneria sp. NPDC052558]|uniref:hypothetical protein n=1 Tax=Kutzneria sp. NPDC052558 TaxID=3364121 RepID=UPI0037CBF5A1